MPCRDRFWELHRSSSLPFRHRTPYLCPPYPMRTWPYWGHRNGHGLPNARNIPPHRTWLQKGTQWAIRLYAKIHPQANCLSLRATTWGLPVRGRPPLSQFEWHLPFLQEHWKDKEDRLRTMGRQQAEIYRWCSDHGCRREAHQRLGLPSRCNGWPRSLDGKTVWELWCWGYCHVPIGCGLQQWLLWGVVILGDNVKPHRWTALPTSWSRESTYRILPPFDSFFQDCFALILRFSLKTLACGWDLDITLYIDTTIAKDILLCVRISIKITAMFAK